MIIIISANKFFINGIRSLVNMTMSAQRRYSQTLFLDNISDVNDKSLTIARTIIVDYSHPDIQQLAALLYRKKRSFMVISFLSLKVRFLPIQSKTLL